MNEKSVSIVASKAKIATVKRLLSDLSAKHKDFEIGKPKYGIISDGIVMNFTVTSSYYDELIEVLKKLGIKIVGIKRMLQKNVEDFHLEIRKSTEIKTREKKIQLSIEQIEKLAEAGKFNPLFEVSVDNLTYKEEEIKKATELITGAVETAIRKLLEAAVKSKYEAAKNIEALMLIATDSRFREHKYNSLKIKAGEAAIKACVIKKRELHYLVQIANNPKFGEIVNYRAFIRLSDVALDDEKKFNDDLDIAVRDINLRWMKIVADTVERKFSGYDLTLYRRMFDYILQNRD